MKVFVKIALDVDVEAWNAEYGKDESAAVIRDIVTDWATENALRGFEHISHVVKKAEVAA